MFIVNLETRRNINDIFDMIKDIDNGYDIFDMIKDIDNGYDILDDIKTSLMDWTKSNLRKDFNDHNRNELIRLKHSIPRCQTPQGIMKSLLKMNFEGYFSRCEMMSIITSVGGQFNTYHKAMDIMVDDTKYTKLEMLNIMRGDDESED